MIAISFNADNVENFSLMAIGGSVIGLLLVLKFAKSVVSKLLLLIVCVGIGVIAVSQRDAVNACVATATKQAQAGNPLDTTCSFFGQEVSPSGINPQP